MTHWNDGYVTEVGYTYEYQSELNPLGVQLAFASAGLVCPHIGIACELGFGQGLSTNIHAAASVTQWIGTDFNPAQVGFAQEMACAAGAADTRLYDQSFAEFANRTDLPDFDYIALHGIWSWISEENRTVIVDFIRKKLKVGGVLYVSYNTFPGWNALAPLRQLMVEHAQTVGGADVIARMDAAIHFADEVLATNPLYVNTTPAAADRFTEIKKNSRNYLVHEYFNSSWQPMYFSSTAKYLEAAKLEFACSATLGDHVDVINLTAAQQALLNSIGNATLRQTVRDFVVEQQFRRDYWVKGARTLPVLDRAELLRTLRLVLVVPRAEVRLTVNGSLGEVALLESVYRPILDVLADQQPKTVAHIEQTVQHLGITFAQIVQAVVLLAAAKYLALAQDDAVAATARKKTDKLNAHLMQQARASGNVLYLASPLTGGGVAVTRFEQLFLLAINQGKEQPVEWAQAAWGLLALQSERIVKEGCALATPEENLAELTAQAQAFATQKLTVLKALQVL